MTQSWLWNGERFLPCDAVPLADRGFRYGMSVFESFPVRDGAPVFLQEHLVRLGQACEKSGFQLETRPFEAVEKLLRGAGTDGFARIYITAGDGPVTAAADACRIFVFLERREPVPSRTYHRGYDLGISAEVHTPLLGGLKTGNYWANLLAFRAGVARQKNESLLFNPDGELISACMANVFVVRGSHLQTPPLDSGARKGIVREWVIRRRTVAESPLFTSDVMEADEIFLTSSWLGIMPAAAIEDRALPSREFAKSLLAEYRGNAAPGLP